MDAVPDEVEYLLDLAAFAENRLDEDEAARIAALIARDRDAADDIAAARLLADAEITAADPGVMARAAALVGETRPEAVLIPFPTRPSALPRPWFNVATWGSLAAAVMLAGWLGFDLGGLLSGNSSGRGTDELSTSEMLDPTPLLLRGFTDNSQI
ncbi:MAG TPA: hypothetical protein VM782_02115 [Stellaceae bacterium]|nr:hypothetical protein [Stellaceae bacterium]